MTCRCGHSRQVHQHYRPGSDCGACGPADCPGYRPRRHLFGSGLADLAYGARMALRMTVRLLVRAR